MNRSLEGYNCKDVYINDRVFFFKYNSFFLLEVKNMMLSVLIIEILIRSFDGDPKCRSLKKCLRQLFKCMAVF